MTFSVFFSLTVINSDKYLQVDIICILDIVVQI